MHGNYRLTLFANSPLGVGARLPIELERLALFLEIYSRDQELLEQLDLARHLVDLA
jgi:hypothetical protein